MLRTFAIDLHFLFVLGNWSVWLPVFLPIPFVQTNKVSSSLIFSKLWFQRRLLAWSFSPVVHYFLHTFIVSFILCEIYISTMSLNISLFQFFVRYPMWPSSTRNKYIFIRQALSVTIWIKMYKFRWNLFPNTLELYYCKGA